MLSPTPLENAVWRLLPQALAWVDVASLTIASANPAAEQLFASTGLTVPGAALLELFHPIDSSHFVAAMRLGNAGPEQVVHLPGGRVATARWLGTTPEPPRTLALLLVTPDTQAPASEDEATQLAWAFDALHGATARAIQAQNEAEFLAASCAGITAQGRYPLAWIGLAADDEQKRVTVAASAGTARHYLDGMEFSWGDNPHGHGPTGQAIRSGKTQLNNQASYNPAFAPWKARAAGYGLAASISVPLTLDGRVVGALMVYSREVNAFGATEVRLFEQLAQYLELALSGFRTREALQAEAALRATAAAKLEQILEQAIETLSETLAERDPYTVGHQLEVAEISLKIARHMGLSEERCHALRLAAVVHDVGKIRIPIELLTKPTVLRPQEMAVLRQHVQATIDILGKIDWPWPLKEIAGQHHERLDGSGYPAGLKGDEIMLESRILAVADTIESMSASRPYRPAKGLPAALAEIAAHQGTKYDAEVVQAALAVMRPELAAPDRGEA